MAKFYVTSRFSREDRVKIELVNPVQWISIRQCIGDESERSHDSCFSLLVSMRPSFLLKRSAEIT